MKRKILNICKYSWKVGLWTLLACKQLVTSCLMRLPNFGQFNYEAYFNFFIFFILFLIAQLWIVQLSGIFLIFYFSFSFPNFGQFNYEAYIYFYCPTLDSFIMRHILNVIDIFFIAQLVCVIFYILNFYCPTLCSSIMRQSIF